MRAEVRKRHVKNVTDAHLRNLLELASGDRQMALDATLSIVAGKTHIPLQRHIAAQRPLAWSPVKQRDL